MKMWTENEKNNCNDGNGGHVKKNMKLQHRPIYLGLLSLNSLKILAENTLVSSYFL